MEYIIEVEKDYKGYHYLVIGYAMGHRCGYVRLPIYHPLYGIDYNEIADIDAHGGLTFSGELRLKPNEYYIGFDCAHHGDGFDKKLLKYFGREDNFLNSSIRRIKDTYYVEEECKRIIEQLIAQYPLFEDYIREAINGKE